MHVAFAVMCSALKKLDIPTVNVITLYRFELSTDTVVLYEPLVGETIRILLRDDKLTAGCCESLENLLLGCINQAYILNTYVLEVLLKRRLKSLD